MSNHTRGFTLIEMLVVLLIMGLTVGLVSTLAQPDDKAVLRVEAERLAQLMTLAGTESRLTGRAIAWTADGAHYRFWQVGEDSGWSRLTDASFRIRKLPAGMTISARRLQGVGAAEPLRVEFSANGDRPAFRIEMTLGRARYVVVSPPVGEIRIESNDGPSYDQLAQR